MRQFTQYKPLIAGMGVSLALLWSGAVPSTLLDTPIKAAPVAAVQATAQPTDPIRWTLTAPAGQTYTTAEINASRMTIFVGGQADAVVLNPTGPATPVNPTGSPFGCTQVGTTQVWSCATTQNAGTILGTTAPGAYRVALGMEFRQLTGQYATRVVSALCNFSFPVIDTRPSIQPTNVRVAAS